MGIFTRFKDIVSANINAMIEKAEDPEKLIKLMVREMEDTLVELKASCAGAMATKKRIARDLEQANAHAAEWGRKAELAVAKGREDLAREALLERRRYTERTAALEAEQEHAGNLIEQYQADILQLEEKLASAREKQRILVQRHIHAQGKKRAESGIRRFETTDAIVRFEQFEQRIDRMEADADLVNFGRRSTLSDRFADIETDDEIERELAALKEKRAAGSQAEQPQG